MQYDITHSILPNTCALNILSKNEDCCSETPLVGFPQQGAALVALAALASPWRESNEPKKRRRKAAFSSVVSFCSVEFERFLRGYDWQSQQRFTRACPHTRSAVTVTDTTAAWRVDKVSKVLVRVTQEQERRVWDYWGCYLLLLFTRRGPIIKVCNLADYLRSS